ncbi:MAG TPA: XdhC family protein [Candidatus Cybelea sp.]|nr:XdhC family protein [Candidatus Cybelea sp.]
MTRPDLDVIPLIASLKEAGESFCIATIVRTEHATSAKAGAKAVVLPDGAIKGFMGGTCVQRSIRETAASVLKEGKPRLIRVKPKDEVLSAVDVDGTELHKSSCPSGGTVDIFVEPMRPSPRLVVCGASPVAIAIADLGRRMGYRIVAAAVADDLGAYDAEDQQVAGFDLASVGIEPADYVVVATQGKRDREALTAALTSDAGYVAFVGSRRKADALRMQIATQGMAPERIARLKAPAGLDIHAIEPEEIALSILAEIVARRRAAVKDEAASGAVEVSGAPPSEMTEVKRPVCWG